MPPPKWSESLGQYHPQLVMKLQLVLKLRHPGGEGWGRGACHPRLATTSMSWSSICIRNATAST